MKNIHVLPTDRPSRLYKFEDKLIKNDLIGLYDIEEKEYIAQHIYIASDEEIKEGDWCLDLMNNTIYVATKVVVHNLKSLEYEEYLKKIILTTDQNLIKDGVQSIDDTFLEWFVKNPSCEEVKVVEKQHFEADKSKRKNTLNGVYYSYKIIIPKEEPNYNMKYEIEWLSNNPQCKQIESCSKSLSKKCICLKKEPKQETLEEAAENHINKLYTTYAFKEILESLFIDGAKWQAERMYSEEDMLTIRNQLVTMLPVGDVTAWDMIQAVSKYTKWFDEYIQSVQPKTEWEV